MIGDKKDKNTLFIGRIKTRNTSITSLKTMEYINNIIKNYGNSKRVWYIYICGP